MKIKIIISIVVMLAAVFIYDAFTNFGSSNQAGAPFGYTGSPGDGISCDNPSCHSGSAITNVTGWITSNIPGSGYIGGTTYTITATATYAGKVKFGFEVSPQDANGIQKGTLVVTDGTHTALCTGSGSKYITHTLAGTSGSGFDAWTFNWVAPVQGSGSVTFYGAFNCTNNNGASTGDLIYLSNLTVPEALTNGTDASISAISNPADIVCSTTFTPSVTLTNRGTSTLTTVNINFKVDNNAPTTFNWTGSLASALSTQCNLPVVTTTAGVHTFTVYTSNPNGGTDAFNGNDTSKINFIVSTTGAALPFTEGFESTAFPPAGWTRVNPDNGTTWARVTTAHSGTASAKMDNYNYASGAGKHDDLVAPTINLSGSVSPKLTFYEAYTYVTGYYDSLQVLISTDCGVTYNSIFYQGGATLSTAPQDVNAFTPTSAQWRLETIDLTPYNSASNAIIIFRNISYYGNNLYLDDINIASASGIYEEQSSLFDVNIFPNPSKDNISVDFTLNNHSQVSIKIYDIFGKMVDNLLSQTLEKGSYTYKFDLNHSASGIYMLNISDNQGTLIKKIVIQ